jgi:ABC-type iron transport system FetAB ATPase subunit
MRLSAVHVLLHAACVTDPDGGGILLVGGSGAGKSTWRRRVRAGYLPVDELADIDC